MLTILIDLLTGFIWGMIKKTWAGWVVFVSALVFILYALMTNPSVFMDGPPMLFWDTIVSIFFFIVGSLIGQEFFDTYWG